MCTSQHEFNAMGIFFAIESFVCRTLYVDELVNMTFSTITSDFCLFVLHKYYKNYAFTPCLHFQIVHVHMIKHHTIIKKKIL